MRPSRLMIVLNMKISPFYLLDPFCPCLRKRAISFAAAGGPHTIRAVQNPSRKTTRSRSIPGDFDTGKTQDPPRGRHTFCVLGTILRFAQRKNTITYLLFYMPEGQTSIGQSHEFVLLYRAYTTTSCVVIGGK